ncbi:hypothetical protein EV424DRAFT_1371411, partial [Suillus variegatus]
MPSVSLTDAGWVIFQPLNLAQHNDSIGVSGIMYYAINGTNVALTAMLSVIMIARLHDMYQGSRMMLMFLLIIFLGVHIACGVIAAITLNWLLDSMVWMLNTVWEVLSLCLSVWIAVKHFRALTCF